MNINEQINSYTEAINHISNEAKKGRLILFIGAGVSSTIVNLSWSDLINKLGQELGYDDGLFKINGEDLELAEYYKLQTGSNDNIITLLKNTYSDMHDKIRDSLILKSICEIGAKNIYTTNYDHLLEDAHTIYNKPNKTILNSSDFYGLDTDTVKIIKLHGDLDDSDSIVLSESSYYERISMETPLYSKFKADILQNTVLFLGYSLRDTDMRYILYELARYFNKETKNITDTSKEQPKIYLFTHSVNKVREAVLNSWNVHTIVSEDYDKKVGMENFLSELVKCIKK